MKSFDDAVANLPQFNVPEDVRRRHLTTIAMLNDGDFNAEGQAPLAASRRRVAAVVGAVVGLSVVGVGTAAAFGIFGAAPTERGVAYCYTSTDPDVPQSGFSVTSSPGQPPADTAQHAVAICAQKWATGAFTVTSPQVHPEIDPNGPRTEPVPPLTACVLESGAVGVFPGDEETCARMGLPFAIP